MAINSPLLNIVRIPTNLSETDNYSLQSTEKSVLLYNQGCIVWTIQPYEQ